jgi:DNA gyrase subunit A
VLVEPSDEVMLISTGGVLIRTSVESIREMGRATQGVTLINLDEGTFLASIEKVAESDADASMLIDEDSDAVADANGPEAAAPQADADGDADAGSSDEQGEV